MAKTISDLYLKYVNKVGQSLENDRYFQYLFEIIAAGDNELQQYNRVYHKTVDEKWLVAIEGALNSLNKVVNNPRRFITTDEEVVPVALARKITADSVRHLSQNTQFLASAENGDVQPTRVLNVTTRETYDLYENRFVNTLIQHLVTFIDKRTDLIFWATGDETAHTVTLNSKIDDAYEEIGYKLEMTIKNRQSFAENDADNMEVFMRIDRVRRLVMALKHSAFCELMTGTSVVRSPIQRTNLLMKDPDYRNCYKLWQFLESYEEVGYSIETIDTELEFDEEYQNQLFVNLITNYTVFKSLLEDPRELDQVVEKRRRSKKPKFIKQIKEEMVDSPDIPDVEVRRVFVEEVTQGQLDAEAKLAEVTAERDEMKSGWEDMEKREQSAIIRAENARADAEEAIQRANDADDMRVKQLRRAMDAEAARDIAIDDKNNAVAAMQVAIDDREEAMTAIKAEKAQMKATLSENAKIMKETKAGARLSIKEAKELAAKAAKDSREAQKAQKEAEKAVAKSLSDVEKAKAKEAEAVNERKEAVKRAAADQRAKAYAEKKRDEALAARDEALSANQGLIDQRKAAQKKYRDAEAQRKADEKRIRELEQLLKETEFRAEKAEKEAIENRKLLDEETALYIEAERRANDNTLGGILQNTFGRRKENE